MTKEEAVYMSQIMCAWADGEKVFHDVTHLGNWAELSNSDGVFTDLPQYYKCSSCEMGYVPFECIDDVLEAIKKHGNVVVSKNTCKPYHFSTKYGIVMNYVLFEGWAAHVSFKYAFKKVRFADGTPFGKKIVF